VISYVLAHDALSQELDILSKDGRFNDVEFKPFVIDEDSVRFHGVDYSFDVETELTIELICNECIVLEGRKCVRITTACSLLSPMENKSVSLREDWYIVKEEEE